MTKIMSSFLLNRLTNEQREEESCFDFFYNFVSNSTNNQVLYFTLDKSYDKLKLNTSADDK